MRGSWDFREVVHAVEYIQLRLCTTIKEIDPTSKQRENLVRTVQYLESALTELYKTNTNEE